MESSGVVSDEQQTGRQILAGLMVLSVSVGQSAAGPTAYNCVINATYDLTEKGFLRPSAFHEKFLGEKFSVSRETGEIIGRVLPTALAISTKVIYFGDQEWSFRTIARFEKNIQVLEVQEFRKGIDKPFVAASMGGAGIVSGVCR